MMEVRAILRIRQLEAFQEVMACGSVTRASVRLNISQPAVSQLVAQLERSCGFQLFDRRGSKILPTREGEALYAEVQRIFVGVDRISRVAVALRDQSWGSIRLAAAPTIARRIVPEIVMAFCRDRPGTRFHLQSMRSRTLIDAIAAQHLDIGISSLPGDRPEVVSEHLFRARAVCILPSSHRLVAHRTITPQDLKGEPFISLGPQDKSKNMIDRVFEEARIPLNIQIEAGQSEMACSFVAENAGISIVDPICTSNIVDDRIVSRPFLPEIYFNFWLLSPKAGRPFNLIESFVEHLKSRITEKMSRSPAG